MRAWSVITGSKGYSDACGLGSVLKILLHLRFPSGSNPPGTDPVAPKAAVRKAQSTPVQIQLSQCQRKGSTHGFLLLKYWRWEYSEGSFNILPWPSRTEAGAAAEGEIQLAEERGEKNWGTGMAFPIT